MKDMSLSLTCTEINYPDPAYGKFTATLGTAFGEGLPHGRYYLAIWVCLIIPQ